MFDEYKILCLSVPHHRRTYWDGPGLRAHGQIYGAEGPTHGSHVSHASDKKQFSGSQNTIAK
jgi:hypothetical protein